MKHKPTGKQTGATLAILAAVLGTYEAIGILTPAPTISRIVQGFRDLCGVCAAGVDLLTALLVTAIVAFGAWLTRHFVKDKRSTL